MSVRKKYLYERKRSYSARNVETRIPSERFLIVCEGTKTEPNYFGSFRVPKDVINVEGLADNTDRIVEEAIRLSADGEYDQVWCVFDRDSFPKKNFNNAFFIAQKNRIKIAYSNEAFELWYLLHFHYYDNAMSRKQYSRLLADNLGSPYKKNSKEMYEILETRQHVAIKNANRLLATYGSGIDPESNNPSTTVHLLVLQLNRFVRL